LATNVTDVPTEPRAYRAQKREREELLRAYVQFLVQRRAERSPEMAHRFALAMRHKGTSLHQSVAEFVVALEGRLPSYWSNA